MKRVLAMIVSVALCGAVLYGLWKVLIEGRGPRTVYQVQGTCPPCTSGWAMNNHGEVAGVITVQPENGAGEPSTHASVWAPGVETTDLGTFGGTESQAQDINDAGQVVGIADLPQVQPSNPFTGPTSDGFIWGRDVGMQRMTPLVGIREIEGISPVGINNRGQVVGCATFRRQEGYHAFFWDPQDGIENLGTLGGKYSCAVDLNDRGQVIGNSDMPGSTAESVPHAFLWEAGKGMQDLGTLGGVRSYARAINNAGQIVGSSTTVDGALHAFLWEDASAITDLGTLGGKSSSAMGINEAGLVVGDSSLPGDLKSRPFLWDTVAGMRDLHDLIDPEDALGKRVILKLPRRINNRGQILVDGEVPAEMRENSVILSPVQKP